MIRNFSELIEEAKKKGPKIVSVACAHDEEVLMSLKSANELGLICGFLVGNESDIKIISKKINFDLSDFKIIHMEGLMETCIESVALVARGEADILMKGLVDTSIILKAVLNKDKGLRSGKLLSHAAIFEVPTYHKIFAVTDSAMNIAPDLLMKKQIIENTLIVTTALGIEKPNVAVLAAKEKVSESMQATLDAENLVALNKKGEIAGCTIGGPFALDNAISKQAAEIKGISDPMAGNVDVLLCPNIESGNILYKALNFLAQAKSAGIIVGANAPIVLTSRADTDDTKLYSIAIAVLMSNFGRVE